MTYHLLFWSGLAFAAGVQPGPFQAFLFHRALRDGWRSSLVAACAPILSDAPIIAITLLLLARMPPSVQVVLRGLGGLLLLVLAFRALRTARQEAEGEAPKTFETLGAAVLINLLNPNPWLAWGLVLGPALLQAWRMGPGLAITVVAVFYATLTSVLAGLILVMSQAARLPSGFRRWLERGSAAMLAGLGLLQIFLAVRGLV